MYVYMLGVCLSGQFIAAIEFRHWTNKTEKLITPVLRILLEINFHRWISNDLHSISDFRFFLLFIRHLQSVIPLLHSAYAISKLSRIEIFLLGFIFSFQIHYNDSHSVPYIYKKTENRFWIFLAKISIQHFRYAEDVRMCSIEFPKVWFCRFFVNSLFIKTNKQSFQCKIK